MVTAEPPYSKEGEIQSHGESKPPEHAEKLATEQGLGFRSVDFWLGSSPQSQESITVGSCLLAA